MKGPWIPSRVAAAFFVPWSSGSGKSHCAQAIGHAVIQQGYRVLYREAHILLEELADATLDGNRKQHVELLTTVPLLIIDDLGMRKLPLTAAEELLEIRPPAVRFMRPWPGRRLRFIFGLNWKSKLSSCQFASRSGFFSVLHREWRTCCAAGLRYRHNPS